MPNELAIVVGECEPPPLREVLAVPGSTGTCQTLSEYLQARCMADTLTSAAV